MKRRRLTLGAALGLAAARCSLLPSQPYVELREWPLSVSRPASLPPRAHGKTLLVRTIQAAPGLDGRGLRVLQADGSVRSEFYERWAVQPADGVTDSLRRWLAASGLFAAVLAPGSVSSSDLALEGELTALHVDLANNTGTVALAVVLIDQHPNPVRVLLQKTERATVALTSTDTPALVHAQIAALEEVLRATEADIAAAVRR
jgi:cholesterol transport system auxiliary component